MKNLRKHAWLLVLIIVELHSTMVSAYVPDDRWSVTASGATGAEGTPITLTWSFAPDGTSIPDEGASNLISYFDGLFNVATTSSDLTTRPWFNYFEQSFNRWSNLGGIAFQYQPSTSTSQLNTSPGLLNVRGDVRIGGALVDGPSNTLAYAWLPDSGDIVVDTGETSFYSTSSFNYRQLRNTIMHEVGHAFGLLHLESSNSALLMEPVINLSIDGPQLDDIRGIQGLYGDANEKTFGGLGNGIYQRATPVGSLTVGRTLTVGSDAVGSQTVSPQETDFVSIANSSDADFYLFSIATPLLLDADLTPLGGVFNQGVEGGQQSSFDANARNDLSLAIFSSNGTTLLGSADFTGAGGSEILSDLEILNPGTYYARIKGSDDNVQLYELQLSASALNLTIPLIGDYNGDGKVSAADYSVWRDHVGTSTLPNRDPNNSGPVGIADYNSWISNYGASSGSGAGLFAGDGISVPEPESILLLIGTLTGLFRMRRSTD